ncbi:MAG TPA: CBS domain-containing protein, partial [Planctomycetota bacterium]|nr:CBS domain-containing protein [Planctomycetota bacterium]
LLLRQDLIAALSRDGGSRTVASAMRPLSASAAPDEPLEHVFERMQVSQLPVLPVFDKDTGKLTGLLTMENVAEVVMIRNAMEKARA